MYTSELIKRIIELCRLDESVNLEERIGQVLDSECGCLLYTRESNPFHIGKADPPLEIHTRAEFREYTEKLFETDQLVEFISRNKNTDYVQTYQKLVKNLAADIKNKMDLEYHEDRDNAQIVAETIHKVIFKKLKKIVTPAYHEIENGKDSNESRYLRELLSLLNPYLKRLGIYTLIPLRGEVYDGVIMDSYEYIPNGGKCIHKKPYVLSVECPAYVIDFIDENGVRGTCCLEGKCVCE